MNGLKRTHINNDAAFDLCLPIGGVSLTTWSNLHSLPTSNLHDLNHIICRAGV
jgi:hypothetical protein